MMRAFAAVGVGQIGYILFQGIFVILSVRYLPPRSLAEYSVGIALFTIVSGLATSVLRRAYVMDFDELDLGKSQGHFFSAQVALLLIILIPASVATKAGPEVVVAVAILILGNSMFESVRLLQQRQENYRAFAYLTTMQAAIAAVGLALLILGARMGWGDWRAGWVVLLLQATSRLAPAPIAGVRIRQIFGGALDLRKGLTVVVYLLRNRYWILTIYFGSLYAVLTGGVLILNRSGITAEIAAYGITQRYYGILLSLVVTAQTILMPALAKAGSKAELRAVISNYYRICIPLTCMVAVIAGSATWWIPLLDGGRYPASIESFQVLAAMIVVSLWTSVHSTVVIKEKSYVPLAVYSVLGLIVTIAASWALLRFGAVGMAVGATCGFSVLSLATAFHSAKLLRAGDSPPNGGEVT